MATPGTTVSDILAKRGPYIYFNTRFYETGSDEWFLWHLLQHIPEGRLFLSTGRSFTHLFTEGGKLEEQAVNAKELDITTLKQRVNAALAQLPANADIATRIKTTSTTIQHYYNEVRDFVNINPRTPSAAKGKSSEWPKVDRDMDMIISVVVSTGRDRSLEALDRLFPNSFHVMGKDAEQVGDKGYFSELRQAAGTQAAAVLCPAVKVTDKATAERLLGTLATNDRGIILKKPHSMQGDGIYRVFRAAGGTVQVEYAAAGEINPGEPPRMKRVSLDDFFADSLTQRIFASGNHLIAMPCLDTSKGDVRVIAANGKVVGTFNRVPTAPQNSDGAWQLGNMAKGAVPQRYDLSPQEKARLQPLLTYLNTKRGMHFLSLDMIADDKGVRYVTEINSGIPLFDEVSKLLVPPGRNRRDTTAEDIAGHVMAAFNEHQRSGKGQGIG